jgi:ElaB/YqjD/DUF883 family membrane-anchored ribosome-binding protein
MSRELDADTLWKIYQDPQFRSKILKDKQALKIFSKGLNGIPALLDEAQSLYKEGEDLRNKGKVPEGENLINQANNLIQQAQSKFATSGLSGQMSVDELISLYRETGLTGEDAKKAVSNLILAMNRRQRTNFLTYNTPTTLKNELGDKNYAPLVEFQKDTPTYKALRGQLEDRLQTPDLDPEQRKELINRLLESYSRGEELGTELERFFGEVVRSTEEEISRLQEELNKLVEQLNQSPDEELERRKADIEQQIQDLESKKSRIDAGRNTARSSLASIIQSHENIAKQFSPEISTSLSQTQPQQSSQTPKQSS